jgi:hypothetical protein
MNCSLQAKRKSDSAGMATIAGLVQRRCACGNHARGGACQSCGEKSNQVMRRAAVNSAGMSDVQRVPGRGGKMGILEGTNYAFDTYSVTEAHLSDPDIIARFQSLSKARLIEYEQKVEDPAVKAYIAQLIAKTPSTPCTAKEITRVNAQAEAARSASLPWVRMARQALDRLHGRWIENKADVLASKRTLSGQVVCAFDSNFNITQRDQNYGVQQIRVSSRLKQLESRLGRVAAYACQPDDDPVCTGKGQDTVAYVRGGQPPIHFCPQFREDPDALGQQSTVVHEYSHLLPGVTDEGGYALGGMGAQIMTCQAGAKFRAPSDVLGHTADALTGFVMHIGQMNATDVSVAQGGGKPSQQQTTPQSSTKVSLQPSATKLTPAEVKAAGEDEDKTKVSVAAGTETEFAEQTESSANISLEVEIPAWRLQTRRKLLGSPLKFFNKFTVEPSFGFKPGDNKHRLFTPLAIEGSFQMFSIEWEKATRAGLFKFELGGAGNVGGEWVPQSNETSIKLGGEGGGELEYRPPKTQLFIKIGAKAQVNWEQRGGMKLEWKGASFDTSFKIGYEF